MKQIQVQRSRRRHEPAAEIDTDQPTEPTVDTSAAADLLERIDEVTR